MILPSDRSPERTEIVLLFRVDEPEQAEALHTFRAAFGRRRAKAEVAEEAGGGARSRAV